MAGAEQGSNGIGRFVQRAAEILGEEIDAARARASGSRGGPTAEDRPAPGPAPERDGTARDATERESSERERDVVGDAERHDVLGDLWHAVTTVVERVSEVFESVLGGGPGRPEGTTAPAPPGPSPGPEPAPGPESAPAPAPEGVAVHRATGTVAPGATATVAVPLPPDPGGARSGRIQAGPLLGPGRGRIPARAVTWTPDWLEEAGTDGVFVTVAVPPGTAPGEYRVLLRGAGFDAVVAVVVGR